MELSTPHPSIYNYNQNSNTVHGDSTVVLNFNPISNVVQQQPRTDSKLQHLYKLLDPLESSTRMGMHIPKDGCLVGTRLELLQQINSFACDSNPPHTCLILGLAGMGKSALARSIADIRANSGLVVASYFISRSIPQSRKTERLVQTLAYQLAKHDAVICERLLATLNSDPGLLQHGVNDQVQRLLLTPLISPFSTVALPLMIIIDGLDEAEDVQVLLSEVVEPLALCLIGLSRHTKLIVSSREFNALRVARSRGGLEGAVDVQWMDKIKKTTVRSDMRMFIANGLDRLRERADLGPAWPTDAQVDALTDRAGSLFIYAATILQFLAEEQYSPKIRLEQLLSTLPHLATTASAEGLPFAKLDALYHEVLLSFVGATALSSDSDLIKRLRMVLSAVVYSTEPMSTRILSSLLGIDHADLELVVRGLAAIWIVPKDRDELLLVHHQSFSEFISDPTRCTEACFCVSPVAAHELLATACLRKMSQGLRRDICNLIELGVPLPCIESYSLGIIEESVEPALRYACLHGMDTHFRQFLACQGSPPNLVGGLLENLVWFCDNHLLHWVEVRAVLGEDSLNALTRTLYAWARSEQIEEIQAWMRASQLLADLHDMVYEFQMTILASPLEVYNTCLALLPNGTLSSAYGSNSDAMVRRITSRPNAWPDTRILFSQAAITTCIAAERIWTACGLVETREDLSIGQSYVLLWSAIPTTPVRLDMPHADEFALKSISLSAAVDLLVTISSSSTGSLAFSSFITVWDLSTLQIISLRIVVTNILGISFDPSGSHVICVTCDLQDPVVCLPISLDGPISRPLHSTGWYQPSFSADGSQVVFGTLRGPLFRAGESTMWRPIELPDSNLGSIYPDWKPPTEPNGARILTSSDGSVVAAIFACPRPRDYTLRVWSLARLESVRAFGTFTLPFDYDAIIGMPALSRDGRLLALYLSSTATSRPTFILGELRWDDQPEIVFLRSWPFNPNALAQISNDGDYVAILDKQQVLKVWDVETGREVAQMVESFEYRHDLREVHPSLKPCAMPLLGPQFTSTGVIGYWNSDRHTQAVLLPLHGNRSSRSNGFSQFCYWLAACLARNEAVLGAVLTYPPIEAVRESFQAAHVFHQCDSSGQGSILFTFTADDTNIVALWGSWIIALSANFLPGRVFETDFIVDIAVFSADRKVIAVTNRSLGHIFVVTLQADGILLRGQYITSSSGCVDRMELDSDGSHLLVRCTWPRTRQVRVFLHAFQLEPPHFLAPSKLSESCPQDCPHDWPVSSFPWEDQWFAGVNQVASAGDQVQLTNHPEIADEDLKLIWIKENNPPKREDRHFSDRELHLLHMDLSSLVGDMPLFVKHIPRLNQLRHPLGEKLVWRKPMLYLNARQGDPVILNFSRHPALLQAMSTKDTSDADPEPSGDDHGIDAWLSDDDYYEENSESGEE